MSIFPKDATPGWGFAGAVHPPMTTDDPAVAEQKKAQAPDPTSFYLSPILNVRVGNTWPEASEMREIQSALLSDAQAVAVRIRGFIERAREIFERETKARLAEVISAGRAQTALCAELAEAELVALRALDQTVGEIKRAGSAYESALHVRQSMNWPTEQEEAKADEEIQRTKKRLGECEAARFPGIDRLREAQNAHAHAKVKLQALEQERDNLRAALSGEPYFDNRTGLEVSP